MRESGRKAATAVGMAALLIGSALAGAAGAALPRDSIEPPELPGGSFEPPANGFAWRVPANFGTLRNGLVDYRWNEAESTRHPGRPYTYDPSYVRPEKRTAFFDGCPSEAELAAGSSTTHTYTWSLHQPASGNVIGTPVSQRNCQWSREFDLDPVTGRAAPVKVRLAITTPAGAPYAGYPAGKTFDEQLVEIRDILIVSLGDSYGSGEGAPDVPQVINGAGFVESEARWVDRRCHRSANAASAVSARQIEAADPHTTVTFLSFACSGATISTGYYADAPKTEPYARGPEQEPLGSGILHPYLGIEPPVPHPPMLESQVDQLLYALTNNDTADARHVDALTISGGGNDMGFGPVALVCTLYWDCKDHWVADANGGGRVPLWRRFEQAVATMPDRYAALKAALGELEIGGTYITQYPDPSRGNGGARCAKILDDVIPVWMAPPLAAISFLEGQPPPLPPYQIDGGDRPDGGEVGWAGGPVLAGMNGAVAAGARANGWTLVDGIADDTANLFSGHGYCADDNWIRTATESVAMQGPWASPLACNLATWYLAPAAWVLAGCFPPTTARTTGTLHPTARGYQAIAGRLTAKMRPQLLPAPPSGAPAAPVLSDVRNAAVRGDDGWLTGQVATHACAGGVARCAPVQVSASVPSATSLEGVSLGLNGSPLPCSAAGVTTGGVTCRSELTNPQTNVWSLSFASDGIYRVEATATARNGTRTDSSFQFKVDLTDPTSATAIVMPPAVETNGWYRTPVEVQLSGVDAAGGSGVGTIAYQVDGGPLQAAPEGATIRLETEGLHTVVVRPIDRAGRQGAVQPPVSVRIDTVAPVVQCSAADGAWHPGDVSIGCTASDTGGSGLAVADDASFSLSTSVAAGSETADAATGTRSVCDAAGNCVDAGPVTGNRVDRKAPSVTVSSPTAGRYLLNQAVAASYTCSDGGSGVATCAGPVPNGSPIDTSSVGERTFTVHAADHVGNAAQGSVTYSVGYRVCLLYDADRQRNAGSVVPILLQVCDAAGANRSSADLTPLATGVVDAAGQPVPLQSPGSSQPDDRFTFDGSSYSFNAGTRGYAPGRYELRFTVPGDSAIHVAPFTIR